jgi:predicted AlkP superfamily phosphohydrolase/phosphomutase
MFCKYLDSRDWDLFFCTLDETHCVGHACWHLLDPDNPRYDPQVARVAGNPIKDVYIAIDEALGAILKRIDDQSTVIVLASHGMGPIEPDREVLEEILRRIEGRPTVATTRGITAIKRRIGHLPIWAQKLLLPLREKYSSRINETMRKRERQSRRYFAIENQDGTGGIRINLKGRESLGMVTAGEEYESVISHLTNELVQLVDGETGEPMVEQVIRREDIDYDGYGGSLPDLVVKWVKKLPAWIESPAVGRINPIYYCRTANHTRMLGLLTAIGPGVVSGPLSDPVRLEDLGPSIAKLLNVPIEAADGRPIDALLTRRQPNKSAVA